MIVSTQSRSASRPRSAWICRFLPSNLNGLVTTAIVSAPSSLARLAITGAAPVPVPPPRPVVTKIMSAPSSAWMILSVSSSAAWRPTFGSAPAPSPLVSLLPICSLIGAGVGAQRLQVGVGDDELDAVEAGLHHAVDGVAAAAADADHLDARAGVALPRRAAAAAARRRRPSVRIGHSSLLVTSAVGTRRAQKNSLNKPRSRPATRTSAPAPTGARAVSPTELR